MNKAILRVEKLTKDFDGVSALEQIDVLVRKGTIHGLIGPNGAGKSTFFNVVTGLLPVTEGRIIVGDEDITGLNAYQISKMGISRTFQEGPVVPSMNCLENTMTGAHQQSSVDIIGTFFRLPFTVSAQEKRLRKQAMDLLEMVGLGGCEQRWANELVWVERQLLQIARALASKPRLLLLDEPTAGMGAEETEKVKAIIQRLVDTGISIILVSHDVKLVMGLAEIVTVISYGRKICDGTPEEVQKDPKVLEAYLGAE